MSNIGEKLGNMGDIVGNIDVIYFKDRGRLHMSKINIARWILLEILFLDF
jgi:hypothetical protein